MKLAPASSHGSPAYWNQFEPPPLLIVQSHSSLSRAVILADCAGYAEELHELVDEPHHEEPTVASHLRTGDEHAPE